MFNVYKGDENDDLAHCDAWKACKKYSKKDVTPLDTTDGGTAALTVKRRNDDEDNTVRNETWDVERLKTRESNAENGTADEHALDLCLKLFFYWVHCRLYNQNHTTWGFRFESLGRRRVFGTMVFVGKCLRFIHMGNVAEKVVPSPRPSEQAQIAPECFSTNPSVTKSPRLVPWPCGNSFKLHVHIGTIL